MFRFPRNLSRGRVTTNGYHTGIDYREFLALAHEALEPAGYLEIGVKVGKSLRYAQCAAVGIDPDLKSSALVDLLGDRVETYLFRCTSDYFFSIYTLKRFLGLGVDFAFLDGTHLFECALRDFINTERESCRGGVIALRNCHPANSTGTTRDRSRSNGQTGDVWKLLSILSRYRPDLRLSVFDCPPSGLAFVHNLDPRSSVLNDAYEEIVAKFRPLKMDEAALMRFREEFPTLDSRSLTDPERLAKHLGRRTARAVEKLDVYAAA